MHFSFVLILEVWSLLRKLGGLGLILMGILDSSVIPTPGGLDVLTVLLAAGQKDWWPYYAGMATIGSVIGGYLTYRLGRKGGQEMLEERLSKRKVDKICKAFEKWGFATVFVPALMPPPIPFSPFVLAAGAMDYPTKKFLLALTGGRAVRFGVVAYLASLYGRWLIRFMGEHYMTIIYVAIGMAVAGVVAFFVLRARRKKPTRPAPETGPSGG